MFDDCGCFLLLLIKLFLTSVVGEGPQGRMGPAGKPAGRDKSLSGALERQGRMRGVEMEPR